MSKPAKVSFFKRIEICLVKGKKSFARAFPLPYKKSLANLPKPQNKLFKILANSTQDSANSLRPFTAATKVIPLNATQFSPEEEILETFFSTIQPKEVEEELYRWFYFGLSRNGNHFANLTPEQIEYFKTKLPLLISSLYDYHRSIRKEAHNGA